MSMMLRRQMLMQDVGEQVGIFTKAYDAILTPAAANSFTIQHNLGITPRFCLIEMDESTRTLTNAYVFLGMVDFNVIGMQNDKTGMGMFWFYYTNLSTAYLEIPNANGRISYDTNMISIGYPYGTSRSSWDTGAEYRARVWG